MASRDPSPRRHDHHHSLAHVGPRRRALRAAHPGGSFISRRNTRGSCHEQRSRRGLRHHAARRPAGRGRVGDRRRQAAHRRAARLPRRALHRGRLAGRQPEGHRVLRPRRHRAAARHVDDGRLRIDPPAEGQGRRRRHAAQPARRQHVGGVHRRQELGLPRAQRAADDARRGRGDDRRLGARSSPATAAR